MPTEKATIVTYPDEFSKEEIKELAARAGYTVVGMITQKRVVKSEYGVGVGKAEELRDMISKNGSKTLIIDEEVTSSQANKLATITRVEVVDRDRLILNIFARRAVTTEAKLQVQLAELKYEMPRARDAVRYSVNGERAGFMGMGETMVDIKFRALKKRMNFINQRLERAQANRNLHRVERRKLGLPFVSLAGYTSSGKTTLFNKLADESREESPDLFTTLTTTMRAVSFGDARKRIMLSDTVGFISRIPTYMVESFKSTLEELTYSDLVLLMIDASEERESMTIKFRSCGETLDQLGVDPKKVILVLNKIDRLEGAALRQVEEDDLFAGFAVLKISAVKGDGLRQLKNRIITMTYPPNAKAGQATVPQRMEFSR
ncbi:MAG TPA: GTPase HflX [Nitrososphaerales archaeon]|nr:GTPase HflX [Nitrososphaerales archaeon]